VTDRGADVRGALDLLMALEREAPAQGGRVLPVLGNHEAMNLVGELRDVTPDICARFAGKDADKVRDDGWREYERLVKARARSRKGEQPLGLTRGKDGFFASYPRGCLEYRRALGPDGAEPTTHHGSGMLRGLAVADGYLVVPPGGSHARQPLRWLPLPS